MEKFNHHIQKNLKLFESPDYTVVDGEELTPESDDVISFIYQISTDAIIFSPLGMMMPHNIIMGYLQRGIPKFMNVKGEFDMGEFIPENIITGRLWVNHDIISIWEYIDGQFSNETMIRKYAKKILKFINQTLYVNVNNYTIEVAEKEGREDSQKIFHI